MKIIFDTVGNLLVIVGCVWFLRGVNMLYGSFMTGQTRWAVYGLITVLAGFGLQFWTDWRERKSQD